MANMEDVHRRTIDGKQDSIDVGRTSIEKLANLEREDRTFWRYTATLWEGCQGFDGVV